MEQPSQSGEDILASYHLPRPLPLWLNPQYAKHIVKGNFMTLSARPKTVEPAEWVAHQGTKFSWPAFASITAIDSIRFS